MVAVNYFSNCDHVEIYLNGKPQRSGYPLHLQKGSSFPKFTAEVPFFRGTLEVIGFVDGKEACRHTLRTPEEPAKISAAADRMNIAADGEDLAFIRVDIHDKNGTFIPDAAEMLNISVSGAGKLLGVCSGDPKSHENEKADHVRTFSGSALVIIQNSGEAGEIRVEITSGKLEACTLLLAAGNK
jgi:beta-galactosidase